MRYYLSFFIFMMMAISALAVGVDERRLDDPVVEARAQSIMKQLRCLVCQNQSIVDSDADLAKDLRVIVRERVLAGDSDEQVLAFMTDRYGNWVLLKPPFDGATIILWLSPLLLLLIGFLIIYKNQTGRRSHLSATPLSDSEQKRLAALLNEKDNI